MIFILLKFREKLFGEYVEFFIKNYNVEYYSKGDVGIIHFHSSKIPLQENIACVDYFEETKLNCRFNGKNRNRTIVVCW
jgi:hypothetical protein